MWVFGAICQYGVYCLIGDMVIDVIDIFGEF